MKYYLPLLLLLLCFSGSSYAQNPSKEQLAEELIQEFDIKESVNFDIDKIVDLIIQNEPQFTAYRKALKEFYTKHLTWKAIKPVFEGIIMQEFSVSELNAINSFLRTPAFKSWVKSEGKVQDLPAEQQQVIMDFTASELGIHFFKVTEDFVKASNDFLGQITRENQEELQKLIQQQTDELVK